MKEIDFVKKKLQYYIDNFENLTDEELRRMNYFIAHKANKQIKTLMEIVEESQCDLGHILLENDKLRKKLDHYRSFIEDTKLDKRFEFYSRGKGAI